jgi:hypothetical protein
MSASPERGVQALAAPDRSARAQRRLPDFFIVGHAKCGTTALYEMLRRHPQIYMPAIKEPQFFAAMAPQRPGSRENPLELTGRRVMSFEEYLALFAAARPEQRVGEASTFYLFSAVAPGRIAQAQPAARIIAIFREPASFLRSVHLQMLQNNAESETDLRKALALDDARRDGRNIPAHATWPQALIYSDRVRYVEQLRRYRSVFPASQVKILIYDDLRRDNNAVVREVLRFLEVDDAHPIEAVEANPTVGLRSRRMNQLRRALNMGEGPGARAARTVGKALTTQRVRRAAYYSKIRRASFRDAPPPDESLMLELRHRFKGEVVALSEYLDRDLVTEWGYDVVD